MSFTLNTFQFGRGILTCATNGGGVSTATHGYKTDDTNSEVNAPGYFPDYIDGTTEKIFIGDLLCIVSVDGTTMVRITGLAPFTYGADLFSNAGSPLVMGAPVAATDGNGGKITGTTLQLEYGDGTQPGILSTGTQTIAGNKTFNNLIVGNAGIRFFGNTDTLSFYDSITFQTTFTIGAEVSSPVTWLLTRIGNMVSISMATTVVTAPQATPGEKFTSDTSFPADFIPTTSGDFIGSVQVRNAGILKEGLITIDSSGVMVIYNDYDTTTDFTSAVSNAFTAASITFTRG